MSAAGGLNHNADESSAFYANNDASSYNTRYLKSIRNKERFQELHFYQCAIELIDELFPKQAQKGDLDPPTAYRASAVTLNQWRELSQEEQLSVHEKEKETQQGENVVVKEEVSNAPPAAGAIPATVVASPAVGALPSSSAVLPAGGGELKRTLVEASSSVQQQPSTTAPVPVVPPAAAPPALKVLKTEPVPLERPIPTGWDVASMNVDFDFLKDRACYGITLDFLRRSYPTEGSKIAGFGCVVADAIQYKASSFRNGLSWPFVSDPRVLGAIVQQQQQQPGGKIVAQVKWICVQVPPADGTRATNSNKLESIQFHHPTCTANSPTLLCENCKSNCIELVSLCGTTLASQT